METIRKNKVFLIDTLRADPSLILQYVHQENIIPERDYSKINHRNHTHEEIIINLLDKVMNRGNESCCRFVDLLLREGIQECYPNLEQLFHPKSPSIDVPVQASSNEITEYKMSSKPRGLCLIINNIKFDPPNEDRRGSENDEGCIKEVFQWLGFRPEVYQNQTGEQMKDLLKSYGQKQHDGDCFVCCIMSHGADNGVCGTNGTIVSSDDIFGPFCGILCPSLINKPKVFFIQACRGRKRHLPVVVQPDSHEGAAMEAEGEMEDEELEADADQMTLPSDADFLVARSTIKGFVSFRNTVSGSWFMQSLYEQLKTYCPRGEEVQYILLRVNEQVSEKSAGIIKAKQMPIYKVTLRKKLVFRVPHPQ